MGCDDETGAKVGYPNPANFNAPGDYSLANKFKPLSNGYLHRFYYYFPSSGPPPNRWFIFDMTANLEIWSTTDDGDFPGHTPNQWAEAELDPPIEVINGREYKIGYRLNPSGGVQGYQSSLAVSEPSCLDDVQHYFGAGQTSNPGSSTSNTYGVDILFSTLSGGVDPDGGGGGASITAISTELGTWLQHENPDLREDSLAKLSYDFLVAENAAIEEAIEKLDASLAFLATVFGPAGAFTAGTLRVYLDNLSTTIENTLAVADGLIGARVDSIYADTQAQRTEAAGQVAAAGVVNGILTYWAQGPGAMAPNTDPGWTEVASGSFAGSFEVPERCDRVYITITSVGAGRATYEVGGRTFLTFPVPWFPILGGHAGRYHTFMTTATVLYEPSVRMDGVFVKLPDDVEGTYSAVIFQPEPEE